MSGQVESSLSRIFLILLLSCSTLSAEKWGYTILLGGQGDDLAQMVATDYQDNAVVAGQTTSPDLAVTPGGYQQICGMDGLCSGKSDIFVARVNRDGSAFLAVTYLGGSGIESLTAIDADSTGILIAGFTDSDNFPFTDGPYGSSCSNGCPFIAKFDVSLHQLLFAIPLPRTASVTALKADQNGDVWFSGLAAGGLQTKGPQIRAPFAGPIYIGKLSSDGRATLFGTYLYGDRLLRLRSDPSVGMYACGVVTNNAFEVSNNATQRSRAGVSDSYVLSFDTNSGALLYATLVGGEGPDELLDCQLDGSGALAVVASSGSYLVRLTTIDLVGRSIKRQREFAVGAAFGAIGVGGTTWLLNRSNLPLAYLVRPTGELERVGSINSTIGRNQAVAVGMTGSLLLAGWETFDDIGGPSVGTPQQWRGGNLDAVIQRMEATVPPLRVVPSQIRLRSGRSYETTVMQLLQAEGGPTAATLSYKIWSDQPWIEIGGTIDVEPRDAWIRMNIGPSQAGLSRGTIFIQRDGSDDAPIQVPVEFTRISEYSPVQSEFVARVRYVAGSGPAEVISLYVEKGSGTSDVPWLKVQKVENTICAVTDPTGLAPGNYVGVLTLTDHPLFTKATILLTVLRPGVSMTSSIFARYRRGSSLEFIAGEVGMQPEWARNSFDPLPPALRIDKVESSESWLHIDKVAGALPGRIAYSIHPKTLEPGRYSATITFFCNGIVWSTAVTLIVGDDIPFTVSPASIAYEIPSAELLTERRIVVDSPQVQTVSMKWVPSAGATIYVGVRADSLADSTPATSPGTIPLSAAADPRSGRGSTGSLELTVGGGTYSLPVAYIKGLPAIRASAIVNAASFEPNTLAPGSIATIFGTQLAVREWKIDKFPSQPLLPWTRVQFTVGSQTRTASALFESPGQLNVQVPTDLPLGNGQVKVVSVSNLDTFGVLPVTIRATSPGIFTYATTRAVVQNANGRVNSQLEKARVGEVVVAYLTGQGEVDGSVATGMPAPTDRVLRATSAYRATIGSVQAEVLFLGLTPGFAGLAQANVRIPALAPGDYPLEIEINGVKSNIANLTVGP